MGVAVAGEAVSRRGFLRLGAGAVAAATGASCGVFGDEGSTESKTAASRNQSRPTLRIAQVQHFVPGYDSWFDSDYVVGWGERNDIEVIVDHIPLGELVSRASAEAAAQRGHDLFAFPSPPSAFEDDVVDHRDLVEEVRGKLGGLTPLVERCVHNPKTGKWFGFPDYWSPNVVNYRADLWSEAGMPAGPDSWDDLRRVGPDLRTAGHPLGLGISPDFDSNLALLSLLHSYGAHVQDEVGNVTLERPATVDAVKFAVDIFKTAMTADVLAWDASSNNRFLVSGRGSFIVNPISGLRAVEKQDAPLAAKVALSRPLAGPAGRFGVHSFIGIYVIWKFAQNADAARRFLVDLAVDYSEAFRASEFYNIPAFPDSVPDLAGLLANDTVGQPPEKYALLGEATEWSVNVGHPGPANAAMDEVINLFLIPEMFARVARGEMSAEESTRATAAEVEPIFAKWRDRKRI